MAKLLMFEYVVFAAAVLVPAGFLAACFGLDSRADIHDPEQMLALAGCVAWAGACSFVASRIRGSFVEWPRDHQ